MIDEKKLIKEIHKLPIQVEVSKAVGHTRPFVDTADILECVENQPKVGEWIPCSKQLPERGVERYLLCLKNGGIFIGIYNGSQFKEISSLGIGEFTKDNEVVAWQPLPKPYKEGKQNAATEG